MKIRDIKDKKIVLWESFVYGVIMGASTLIVNMLGFFVGNVLFNVSIRYIGASFMFIKLAVIMFVFTTLWTTLTQYKATVFVPGFNELYESYVNLVNDESLSKVEKWAIKKEYEKNIKNIMNNG